MSTTITNGEIRPYLRTLQKTVPEFNEYWCLHGAEIGRFEEQLVWRIDPDRSPSSRHTPTGYIISLKTLPKSFDDAHIVSHEMEHCRLWEKGYPNIQPQYTDKKIDYISRGRQCAAISNMIYNPMIELHISSFFDSCQKNKRIYENKLAEWIKLPLADDRDLFCFSCYYVTGIITIKWLCGNTNNTKNLKEFRKERQGDIISCSSKICSFLERNHFTRPEEKSTEFIQRLFSGLITEFNLNCFSRPK